MDKIKKLTLSVHTLIDHSLNLDLQGYELRISYDPETQSLNIENQDLSFPSLEKYLGRVVDNAIVSLISLGYDVSIHNGKNFYDIFMVNDKPVYSPVDKIQTLGSRFGIYVKGIKASDWGRMRGIHLDSSNCKYVAIETPWGDILLSNELDYGAFYVNGLLLHVNRYFRCAYNLNPGCEQNILKMTSMMWNYALEEYKEKSLKDFAENINIFAYPDVRYVESLPKYSCLQHLKLFFKAYFGKKPNVDFLE